MNGKGSIVEISESHIPTEEEKSDIFRANGPAIETESPDKPCILKEEASGKFRFVKEWRSYVFQYDDYPNIVGQGASPEEAKMEAEANLKVFLDYRKEVQTKTQKVHATDNYLRVTHCCGCDAFFPTGEEVLKNIDLEDYYGVGGQFPDHHRTTVWTCPECSSEELEEEELFDTETLCDVLNENGALKKEIAQLKKQLAEMKKAQ